MVCIDLSIFATASHPCSLFWSQNVANAFSAFRHVTAEDVDPSLTSYGLETQQNPVGAIDIIGLSEQYILAQIESNQTTSNGTLTNNITVLRRWQSPHTKSHAVHHNLHLQRRVDGPIQCGVGQPCLDGSCCNKLGKCGYKAAQCAPDNCLSNCDAKAMCGIDSADGRTLCGLKLCCSFYGWCGTEDVHCKDPEPLIGKT
jgi:chitinase